MRRVSRYTRPKFSLLGAGENGGELRYCPSYLSV